MNSVSRIAKRCLVDIVRYAQFKVRMTFQPPFVELNGIRLELDGSFSHSTKSRLIGKRYEQNEAKCILTKLSKEDIVLEIGAGLGYLSALCSKIVGSERVFAYEANPFMMPFIKRNHSINAVDPSVINAAVVAHDRGETPFFIEEEISSSSIVRRSSNAHTLNVPAVYVNEEIKKIKPTCLILDVEGYESELVPVIDFSGIRVVILELHAHVIGSTSTDKVRAHLTNCGFTLDPFISRNQVLLLEKLHWSSSLTQP